MAHPIIRIATQLLRFVLCLELVPPEFNHLVTNYEWRNYDTLQKNISFFLFWNFSSKLMKSTSNKSYDDYKSVFIGQLCSQSIYPTNIAITNFRKKLRKLSFRFFSKIQMMKDHIWMQILFNAVVILLLVKFPLENISN